MQNMSFIELKPTYRDFFSKFKNKLGNMDIRRRIKSVRIRAYRVVAKLILLFTGFILLFLGVRYFTGNVWLQLSTLLLFIIAFFSFIWYALDKNDDLDLKDMVKAYENKYQLTHNEKASCSALAERIRFEELSEYFGNHIYNVNFIRQLKEIAKEKGNEAKIEVNIMGLATVAILLAVFSSYLGAAFNLWKEDNFEQLSIKAILIGVITLCLGGLIYVLKNLHIVVSNISHREHKEIYCILQEIETRIIK
jgi:disulfide bond formation protein DsbB